MQFEQYGDLIDQGFLQFNENLINNQDPHSKIENGETPGAEYPTEHPLNNSLKIALLCKTCTEYNLQWFHFKKFCNLNIG